MVYVAVFGRRACMRHAEKIVSRLKTPLCVHSRRLVVYRHHVHMYKTCGRVAGTHGALLNVHTQAC